MTNISKSRFHKVLLNLALIVTLLIASYFRFTGVSPGYPSYHSDEGISYSAAVSMIKNENLDPLRYDYPAVVPLTNYITIKYFFIPVNWTRFYVANAGKFLDGYYNFPLSELEKKKVFQLEILGERDVNALFWGRYTTAFLGVLSVLLVYKIGKRLEKPLFGLLAASFVAVNYRHVLNSHLGLPDIYNGFFLLLTFLFTLKLWKKPDTKAYIFVSIFAGISFATKYQFFSFFSLIFVHLYLTISRKTAKEKLKYLFRKEAIVVPFVVIFVFVFLNPYMFVKIEETIDWLVFVAGKYRSGKNSLDFFPYSYLYHFAIGKEVFILTVIGIALSIIFRFKKSLLILGIVLPFLYITTFATGGGFYTRNFVSVIPFFCILAAYAIYIPYSKLSKYFLAKIVMFGLVLYVLVVSSKLSFVVANEYEKPWNFKITQEWLLNNLPKDASVAAHSSVPLPKSMKRLFYEQSIAFNLAEFREQEAEFAGANLDWVKVDYYWWMTRDTKTSLAYWNRPEDVLNQMFATLSIRELAQYAVFSEMNNPRAPDSDFIISVVPNIEVEKKELIKDYDFSEGNPEWSMYGTSADNSDNLKFENEALEIIQTPGVYFASGWKSDPIFVSDLDSVFVEYSMKTDGVEEGRDGYLALLFYKTREDIENENPEFITLSTRNFVGEKNKLTFSSVVPEDSNYLVIRFHEYQYSLFSSKLFEVNLFNAESNIDYRGYSISPIKLSPTQLFPESHGNL